MIEIKENGEMQEVMDSESFNNMQKRYDIMTYCAMNPINVKEIKELFNLQAQADFKTAIEGLKSILMLNKYDLDFVKNLYDMSRSELLKFYKEENLNGENDFDHAESN